MHLPTFRARWNVLDLFGRLTSRLAVILILLIRKVSFPLVVIPLPSLGLAMISRVPTILVVVALNGFILVGLFFLTLV